MSDNRHECHTCGRICACGDEDSCECDHDGEQLSPLVQSAMRRFRDALTERRRKAGTIKDNDNG